MTQKGGMGYGRMETQDEGDIYIYKQLVYLVVQQKSIQHCKATVKVKSLSRVQFFGTRWTVAYQAPLTMGFSRQEYWSGLPFPSLGDLPNPGIKPRSPTLQADALTSEPPGKPLNHNTFKNILKRGRICL